MALYISEHTKFINGLLKKNPQWVDAQRNGRALWWDKPPQKIQASLQANASKLPRKPYPYDSHF